MSKEALRKSVIALELLESDARRLLKEIEANGPLFAQKRVVMAKQAQFVVDALDECRRFQHSAQPEQRTLLRALRHLKMGKRFSAKTELQKLNDENLQMSNLLNGLADFITEINVDFSNFIFKDDARQEWGKWCAAYINRPCQVKEYRTQKLGIADVLSCGHTLEHEHMLIETGEFVCDECGAILQ